jgi:hypothetical protein
MSILSKSIVLGFQTLLVGCLGVVAQDREITRSEFMLYMSRALQAAKDMSFRERATTEMSDFPIGPWEYHDSYRRENVFPDRYHFIHLDDPFGESIQIGRVLYHKAGKRPWTVSEPGAPGISTPAGIALQSDFKDGECKVGADNDLTAIRCASKRKYLQNKETDMIRRFNTFWLDGSNRIVKLESIVFTSRNWARTILLFEYDPSIRVEAPM